MLQHRAAAAFVVYCCCSSNCCSNAAPPAVAVASCRQQQNRLSCSSCCCCSREVSSRCLLVLVFCGLSARLPVAAAVSRPHNPGLRGGGLWCVHSPRLTSGNPEGYVSFNRSGAGQRLAGTSFVVLLLSQLPLQLFPSEVYAHLVLRGVAGCYLSRSLGLSLLPHCNCCCCVITSSSNSSSSTSSSNSSTKKLHE